MASKLEKEMRLILINKKQHKGTSTVGGVLGVCIEGGSFPWNSVQSQHLVADGSSL